MSLETTRLKVTKRMTVTGQSRMLRMITETHVVGVGAFQPPCQPAFTAHPENREGSGQRGGPLPPVTQGKSSRSPGGGRAEGGARTPQSEKQKQRATLKQRVQFLGIVSIPAPQVRLVGTTSFPKGSAEVR